MKTDYPKPEVMWAVMAASPFSQLQAHGFPVEPAEGMPRWFIPLFETQEQARAWAGPHRVILPVATSFGTRSETENPEPKAPGGYGDPTQETKTPGRARSVRKQANSGGQKRDS